MNYRSLKIKISLVFSLLIAIAFSLNWMVASQTIRGEKIEDLEKVLKHLLIESGDEYIAGPLERDSDLSYLYQIPHNQMIVRDSEASHLRFIVSNFPYVSRDHTIAASVKLQNGYYLNAMSDDAKVGMAVNKYSQKLLVRYLFSLMAILVISIFLLDYYMKPLAVLAQKTREWNSGDPFEFSLDDPGQEIEEVSHAFSALIGRLEGFRTKEKELFKEAAHELKTPLALMRSRLDVYEGSDRYDKAKFITDLGHDIERLLSELKNVLFLESSDFEAPVSVNVNGALRAILRKVDILAQRKQLRIQLPAESFSIQVSEKLLNKVFIALIENAMTYAQERSVIDIKIDPIRRTLSVENEIGAQKYLFSSKIGQKMLTRLSEELRFTYKIAQDEKTYTIELTFS